MNKKGVSVAWFLAAALILVLAGIVIAFIYQTNPIGISRTFGSVDEKPSFSTYVESAYGVAADCYLKRLALSDVELGFTDTHPAIIPDAAAFMESIMDEVFQNFTVFQGRAISKGTAHPTITLREDRVDVQVDQKFSIKVDGQDHRISQFITTLPTRIKTMLSLRNKALRQKDVVLNEFYPEPFHAAAYQKKDAAIITLTDPEGPRNQEMKYVFVT